jgi:hypothetical protein
MTGTRLLLSPLAALARLRRALPLVCTQSAWHPFAHANSGLRDAYQVGPLAESSCSLTAAAAAEGITCDVSMGAG